VRSLIIVAIVGVAVGACAVYLVQEGAMGGRGAARTADNGARELSRVEFENEERVKALQAEIDRLRAELAALRAQTVEPVLYPDDTPEKVERLLQDAYATNNIDWLIEVIERLLLLGDEGYPLLRTMILDIVGGKFLPARSDFRMDQLYKVTKLGAKREKQVIEFLDFLLKDAQTPSVMKQFAMMGAAYFVGSKADGAEELQQTLMNLFLEQQGGAAAPIGFLPPQAVQKMQVWAMAFSGDPRMIGPLRDQFSSTKDPGVKSDIIGALAYLGDPKTVPLIKERLDPNQGDFRREIEALGRVGTDESHEVANQFLRSIPDGKRFYRHASRYVGAGGGNTGVMLIRERVLADPTDDSIGDAIGALRRYPTKESLDTLNIIGTQTPNQEIAKRAQEAAKDIDMRMRGAIPGLERKN